MHPVRIELLQNVGRERINGRAQRLPRDRHAVPTAQTIGPNHVIANHRIERGDILRITATITTLGFLPVASRRSWKVLSAGFQLQALIAAM
jgi:hypothetical protein